MNSTPVGDNTRNAIHENLHLKRPLYHARHTSLGPQSDRRDFPKLKQVIIGGVLSRMSERAQFRFYGPVASTPRKKCSKTCTCSHPGKHHDASVFLFFSKGSSQEEEIYEHIYFQHLSDFFPEKKTFEKS